VSCKAGGLIAGVYKKNCAVTNHIVTMNLYVRDCLKVLFVWVVIVH